MSTTEAGTAYKVYVDANKRFVEFYLKYAQTEILNFDDQKQELANLLKALSICERQQWWTQLSLMLEAIRFSLEDLGYWTDYKRYLELLLFRKDVLTFVKDRLLYLTLLDDYSSLLYTQGERDNALALYKDLVVFASQEADDLMLAYAYYGIGQVLLTIGQLNVAEEYWQLASRHAQNVGETSIASITNYLLSSARGEVGPSLKVEIKAGHNFPKMVEWKRYIEGQFTARRYFDSKQLPQAQLAYLEVCGLAKQLDDQDGLSLALFHLAEISRMSDQPTQAVRYYRESEQIALRLNNHIGLASTYAGLGRVYLFRERYDLALPYLEECVRLEREFGEDIALAENLHLLAYAAANTGNPQYAKICLQEARTIFVKFSADQISQIDNDLARLQAAVNSSQ